MRNKLKMLVGATMAVNLLCAFAGDEATDADKEASRAAAKEKILRQTGGIVEREEQGEILIVDWQTKVAFEEIEKQAEALRFATHVKVRCVREGMPKNGLDITDLKPPQGSSAALFVVNEPKMPMSLVAVEAKWGLVNVAKLDTSKRFAVEFARVATLTFGAGASQLKGSCMQTVTSAQDLDKIIDARYKYDAVISLMKNLQGLGVMPKRKASYKKACQEGWAPQPTNEYQRAIWNQINAIPDKPITIEYDPKVDK